MTHSTCGHRFFIKLVKIVAPFILLQVLYLWIYRTNTPTAPDEGLNLKLDTRFINATADLVLISQRNITSIVIVNKTHSINQTYVAELKAQLAAAVNTDGQFILSQSNVKIGNSLRYAINTEKTHKIDKTLHRLLPKQSPFTDNHFNRCSVVGSGGILLDSRCGKDIDKADYIFRCNAAPVKKFTNDTGEKTNLTTINQSVVWRRFHGLKSKKDKSGFIKFMQEEDTDFLIPVLSVKSGYSAGKKILETMIMAKNPTLQAFSIHPHHFTSTQDFWKSKGLLNRLSTGFYLTSAAISLCDEVHLYGFWPFTTDPGGNEIPYHYYDELKFAEKQVHNFTTEFRTLSKFHRDGIINLHVNPCEGAVKHRNDSIDSISNWIYTRNSTETHTRNDTEPYKIN